MRDLSFPRLSSPFSILSEGRKTFRVRLSVKVGQSLHFAKTLGEGFLCTLLIHHMSIEKEKNDMKEREQLLFRVEKWNFIPFSLLCDESSVKKLSKKFAPGLSVVVPIYLFRTEKFVTFQARDIRGRWKCNRPHRPSAFSSSPTLSETIFSNCHPSKIAKANFHALCPLVPR